MEGRWKTEGKSEEKMKKEKIREIGRRWVASRTGWLHVLKSKRSLLTCFQDFSLAQTVHSISMIKIAIIYHTLLLRNQHLT